MPQSDPLVGASPSDLRAEDWPSPRHANTALALLMVGLVVAILDRGTINLLVEPIKHQYRLSDTQFGALQGIAFGAFYVVASIPLGILADRYQRRIIVGIGVTIFSLFSFGTGLARSYTQLFAARMGVGFGEASMSPSGFALISDYFPPSKLARAASLFNMSNFVGASLSLVIGGQLIGLFDRMAHENPGQLLGFAPWQLTIMCIALPGFILAPLLFLIREPPRRGLVGTRARLGLRETLRELGKRRLFLFLVISAMSMGSIMTNSFSTWTPALFIRVYGWSAPKVGLLLGIIILIGAVVGSYLGGWITDRLTLRKQLDAPLKVAIFSFIGVGIFGVATPLMPSGELSLALVLIVFFLKPMAFALAPLSLQLVIPNQLRSTTTALYFTIINLLGLLIGPTSVGLMTDRLFTGPTGVRYSMVVMTGITVPLMVLLLVAAIRPFKRLRNDTLSTEIGPRPLAA
jgi:MFS family permease